MKKISLLVLGMLLIIACKDDKKPAKTLETTTKEVKVVPEKYPADLQKVFDIHGGIDKWNAAQTLVYEMVKPDNTEKHITEVHSRKTRLEGKNFTIGYDGKDVWLAQKDTTAFKSNARFYHNLYFYFYAMPFVLGDDGITYDKVKNLSFEGVSYPGYKISYGDNVGDSPEDNYFIYYNPDTFQMEWLGYTVTYFKGEPSTRVSYIRYSEWQKVDGVVLPKTLTWYNTREGKITEVRNAVEFTNVSLNKKMMDNNMYAKPADGVVVPKG